MLKPFADDDSLFQVIRIAQMAPSVHNTQPWVFWIRADDRMELRASVSGGAGPDFLGPDRRLLVADPLSRELAISCGAALFNLRLAFRVMGHDVAVWLLPDQAGDTSLLASVEIVTGRIQRPTVKEQKLYSAIPRRHTNRSPFTDEVVPPTVQHAMKRAAFQEEGWLRSLDRAQAGKWVRAAAQADMKLEEDPGYVGELRRWTRGRNPGSGVPAAAAGAGGISGDAPVRDYGLGGRPRERFERHPQLLALSTDGDQPADWLRAGQALQRVLLTATLHGVSASFLTQPMELSDHRDQSRRWPWRWPFAEVPQMMLRVGYATRPAAFTPRRNAPDVLDLRTGPPRRVLPPAPHQAPRTAALPGVEIPPGSAAPGHPTRAAHGIVRKLPIGGFRAQLGFTGPAVPGHDSRLGPGECWVVCRPRRRVSRPEVKRWSRSSAQAWVPCAARVGKLSAGRERRNACRCCRAAGSRSRCSAGEAGSARAKPRV